MLVSDYFEYEGTTYHVNVLKNRDGKITVDVLVGTETLYLSSMPLQLLQEVSATAVRLVDVMVRGGA